MLTMLTSTEEKLLIDAMILRDGLEKYGNHLEDCKSLGPEKSSCTCGLDELLALDPARHFE